MCKEIKKAGGIIFTGFVALKLTEAFSEEINKSINDLSNYLGFLDPNIILNLVGYSMGNFIIDLMKAGIIIGSAFGTYKILKD